jgi:hypothetical protein
MYYYIKNGRPFEIDESQDKFIMNGSIMDTKVLTELGKSNLEDLGIHYEEPFKNRSSFHVATAKTNNRTFNYKDDQFEINGEFFKTLSVLLTISTLDDYGNDYFWLNKEVPFGIPNSQNEIVLMNTKDFNEFMRAYAKFALANELIASLNKVDGNVHPLPVNSETVLEDTYKYFRTKTVADKEGKQAEVDTHLDSIENMIK